MKVAGVLLTCLVMLALGHRGASAPSPAPALSFLSPASGPGTLGSYCSSLQGLQALLTSNSIANFQAFNITVPSPIANPPLLVNVANILLRAVEGLWCTPTF